MSVEQFEGQAVELLAQIQASAAEYVRQLNENGARLRRESDEVHRQHDAALKSLQQLNDEAKKIVVGVMHLVSQISQEWPKVVLKGAEQAVKVEAERYVSTQMQHVEKRMLNASDQLQRLSASLDWKHFTVNVAVAVGVSLLFVGFIWWHFGS